MKRGNRRFYTMAIIGGIISLLCRGQDIMAAPFEPALLRAEIDTTTLSPGESFNVTLWLANRDDEVADDSYIPFVHPRLEGLPEDNQAYLIFGGEVEPYPPSYLWTQGRVVEVNVPIAVPIQAKAGVYQVLAGLYKKSSGKRITLFGPKPAWDTRFLMGTITVTSSGKIDIERKPLKVEFVPETQIIAGSSKTPTKSGDEVKLSNERIKVFLNAERPEVLRIEGLKSGILTGDNKTGFPQFYLWREKQGELVWSYAAPDVSVTYKCQSTPTRAIYKAQIYSGKELAVECDIFYILTDKELRVGFENVKEMPGYMLNLILWPRLLAATGKDARMVVGRSSGRLIDPALCKPGMVTHTAVWSDPIVGGLLYNSSVLAAMTTDSPDDSIISSVSKENAVPSAGFGLQLTHRYTYPGTPVKHWFVSQGSSMARIRYLSASEMDLERPLDWTDGARLLREEVMVTPPKLYQDTVLYKILNDFNIKLWPIDRAYTINKSREIVSKIYRLTDGQKQIVYLVGTAHEGLESKYPDMFTMNPRVGTYDELVEFINEGPKYNAIISFHSAIHDMYMDSPLWDESVISRDLNGGLYQYGGAGYWINFDLYVNHGLRELVHRLFSMYPITQTYHLDVLTTRAANIDFNPAHPTGGSASYTGRLKVIGEFNRHGIDVTSEGFMSWFVGHIGHAWLLRCDPYSCFDGDEAIPFVPFVYHGHATYGLPSENSPLLGMLYGAAIAIGINEDWYWSGNDLMDCLYLQNFPYQMLRLREMEGYSREGNIRRVTYDKNTYVQIEVPNEAMKPFMGYKSEYTYKYEIVVDGRLVSKDFSVFVPSPRKGAYIAYARNADTVTYPAPEGWTDSSKVKITPLVDEKPSKPVKVTINKSQIILELPGKFPVRLEYR